jgi:hypothetical protein
MQGEIRLEPAEVAARISKRVLNVVLSTEFFIDVPFFEMASV